MKLSNPLRVVTLLLLLTTAPFLLAQDEQPAAAEPRIPAESGQVPADIDGSTHGLRASPPSYT